jgi:hypothetical protein
MSADSDPSDSHLCGVCKKDTMQPCVKHCQWCCEKCGLNACEACVENREGLVTCTICLQGPSAGAGCAADPAAAPGPIPELLQKAESLHKSLGYLGLVFLSAANNALRLRRHAVLAEALCLSASSAGERAASTLAILEKAAVACTDAAFVDASLFPAAERMLRELLQSRLELLGASHPDTVRSAGLLLLFYAAGFWTLTVCMLAVHVTALAALLLLAARRDEDGWDASDQVLARVLLWSLLVPLSLLYICRRPVTMLTASAWCSRHTVVERFQSLEAAYCPLCPRHRARAVAEARAAAAGPVRAVPAEPPARPPWWQWWLERLQLSLLARLALVFLLLGHSAPEERRWEIGGVLGCVYLVHLGLVEGAAWGLARAGAGLRRCCRGRGAAGEGGVGPQQLHGPGDASAAAASVLTMGTGYMMCDVVAAVLAFFVTLIPGFEAGKGHLKL